MSKLDQIVAFLETENADIAVISDPVTINYLTGFYSDPHERLPQPRTTSVCSCS